MDVRKEAEEAAAKHEISSWDCEGPRFGPFLWDLYSFTASLVGLLANVTHSSAAREGSKDACHRLYCQIYCLTSAANCAFIETFCFSR